MFEINDLFLVASVILLFGTFIAIGVALTVTVCEVVFRILNCLKWRLIDYIERKYFGGD